jgi:hypothetical protein
MSTRFVQQSKCSIDACAEVCARLHSPAPSTRPGGGNDDASCWLRLQLIVALAFGCWLRLQFIPLAFGCIIWSGVIGVSRSICKDSVTRLDISSK